MINRRKFFRGVSLGAGGLLLTQFLDQLEAAESGRRPARFVFFVQGNGLYPDQIQPQGIARPKQPTRLEDRPLTDHAFARSVSPLERFADRVTFLHGLSGRVQMEGHGAGFSTFGCWPSNKLAYGTTIDAWLGRRLGGLFPHVGLGVQNQPAAVIYNITSFSRGKPAPTQCNPLLAYRRLFSVAAEGEARKEFDARTNLLDFMARDVRRVATRLRGQEKEKLDRYLEAFESMRDRQNALVRLADRIAEARPDIDPTLADVSFDRKRGNLRSTRVFERLEAQCEIAAACLIAGLTNVVTISSGVRKGGTGVSCAGPEIGLSEGLVGSHTIGHGGAQCGADATECHIRIRQKHMEALVRLIERLQSVPEGDGTMMDNTLVVFCSDAADSHHPSAYEWPFVLIGDLGGRLKLGNRYLRYPWYGNRGHRTVANLYVTLLHAVGENVRTFGFADPRLKHLDQSGPLEEIL